MQLYLINQSYSSHHIIDHTTDRTCTMTAKISIDAQNPSNNTSNDVNNDINNDKLTYQPAIIESAQQQLWQNERRYEVSNQTNDKPKRYMLSMFPYPSGKLHMGHVRNYTISDVLSRYYRLKGHEVMQPMGWDAFGLPAENAAIAHHIAPADWTYKNIANMREQLKSLGLSIDWSREFATCDADYYRWEQWLFIQLFKKGLVYKKLATVNWDPVDNTVLANEQVVDGRGWRSGALVEKRDIPMYYFKITDYADELLDDLDQLEGHWPKEVLTMQRNWIGRSQGMEVHFPYTLNDKPHTLDVFTTRPDTLMGVTYVAVAAEHPLAQHAAENNSKIAQFIQECKQGSVAEKDLAKAEKKGMDTGLSVTHPITGKDVPVWVANYVLMSYGSGAVMAVPAHDERDFEFANKYALPIKQVIKPDRELTDDEQAFDNSQWQDWYAERGISMNSDNSGEMNFDGLDFDGMVRAILATIESQGLAHTTINYRLRDWGVSRQRYWGCPIPTINCEHCGTVPVDEADLPVVLPTDVIPDGKGNPLNHHQAFLHTTCPKCDSDATRETDTFDTFMESSWYYARFASPHFEQGMIDKTGADKWLPVDQYVGGVEHAVMHLLYARFFHKLMRDEGLVSGDEPFANLLTQGMVLAGTYLRHNDDGSTSYYYPHEVDVRFNERGQPIDAILKADGQPVIIGKIEKMSKSKNNGVDPQQTIDTYGADTVRLYTLFTAPADQTLEWSDDALKGPYNFLKKVWRYGMELSYSLAEHQLNSVNLYANTTYQADSLSKSAKDLRRKTHETINKLDDDLGKRLALNTPVSSLMELANELGHFNPHHEQDLAVANEALVNLLILLSPYAPHMAEALLTELGHDTLTLKFPNIDETALVQDSITMVIQVNGKVRGKMQIAPNSDPEQIKAQAKQTDSVAKFLIGDIKKEIIVPNKLINIVVVPA